MVASFLRAQLLLDASRNSLSVTPLQLIKPSNHCHDTSGVLAYYAMLLSNYAFLDHLSLDLFIVLFQDVMCSHFVSCSRLCILRITTNAAHALRSRQRHTHVSTKEFKFVIICCHPPFNPEVLYSLRLRIEVFIWLLQSVQTLSPFSDRRRPLA